MADEKVSIVVTDGIDASVSKKLKGIGADARKAGDAVQFLQQQLKTISASSGLSRLQSELAKTAILQQRLADQTNKTNASYFNAEAALNKAIAAENRAAEALARVATAQAKVAVEAQRLATAQQQTASAATNAATAQQQLATAQTNTLTANQRLTNAQTQGATAATNNATATTRAATAQAQGQIASQNLANATTRAATAQVQGAGAAQRLATEQQRTAVQTANASSASDRAALAALRLAQAQQRAADASERSGSSMARFLRHAIAVAGVTLSAQAVIGMADGYTVLQNKLQNVTTSQAQVNVLTEELYALAIRTRSGVDQTATAFTRFDRSLKQMGKSQQESLRLTETVNKAMIVSGATTSESASALLQLSQAFNAGKLQGDEFRAVAENMPMVLDAVATVLKRPINEVKKLGTEGKITAKVLFDAFKSIETSVDTTFGRTTSTVAEGLKVLNTQASKFFGELNKATGFTNGLNYVLRAVGNNLANIAGAMAVVGVATAIYFGPVLLNTLSVATRSMWLFTAAVAANPIGLLAVGIAAALTTIALFGDKIKISSDGLITLKDVALSTWAFISDGVGNASKVVSAAWNTAVDKVNEKTNGMAEPFRKVGSLLLDISKNSANGVVGFFLGMYNAIRSIWSNFPTLMQGYFYGAVNFGADAVETLVNSWQVGLRLIAKATETLAPDTSKAISSALDAVKIQLPRLDTSGAKDAARDVSKAFMDSINTDYVGDAADAIMRRAKSFSVARELNSQTPADAALRGAGKNQLSTDKDAKAAKAAERRSLAMQKINEQLDNEISRMFVLQPQRDAQARFDQIEESLIQKKIKLTGAEASAIQEKIKKIQEAALVQQRYDAIYQEAIGPQQTYNANVEASRRLVDSGAISVEQYTTALARSKEEYENAADPMRKYNQDLQDQLAVLKFLPNARNVEQQMLALERDTLAKGTPDREKYLEQKREELTLLDQRRIVGAEVDRIYNETLGAQTALGTSQIALNESLAAGTINLDNYLLRYNQLSIAQANLNLQMQEGSAVDVMTASLGKLVEGYEGAMSGLRDSFGSFFTTITDGFANSIGQAVIGAKSLKEGFQDVAKQGISSLISGLVKLGIQWAINAALGKSIEAAGSAATIALSAVTATAVAAAWAPAAAAVSLATMGGNSVPAMAGITATNALSTSMSQGMGLLAAFEDGGYTGNYGRKQIAGVVHGKEYVVNAEGTARNRGLLEAINSGQDVSGAGMGSGGLTVSIYNYGSDTVTAREEQGPNGRELKIFIQETVREDISNGGAISGVMESQYQLNRAYGINR